MTGERSRPLDALARTGGIRLRVHIVVLILVLVLVPASVSSVGPDPGPAPDCGFVPGIGEACRVEGGYVATMPDGSRHFTHGGDFDPARDEPLLAAAGFATERAPPCIDEPLLDYHAHYVYAHPVDLPDRSAELAPELRRMVAEANGLLYQEGAGFGAPVEYPFLCDEDGQIQISVVALPFPKGKATYVEVAAFLHAAGFAHPRAKYWLFVDDKTSCPCGGIAFAPLDPTRTPLNNANGGALFGANYGYTGSFGALVHMHENGHNLGAVNSLAPDQSGGGHCNDGKDIMCYADGGWNSSYNGNVCATMRFDCDHDTYFHPDPPAGSYLARRWQIGAPVDRFVQGCLLGQGRVLAPGLTADLAVPVECQGNVYAIYGEHAFAASASATSLIGGGPAGRFDVNKFTVCWYAGGVQLACPSNSATWGHEGRVPLAADRAVVTWTEGADGRFTLSVI